MPDHEPIELKITNETIPSGQIGRMTSEPPGDEEAGGRGMVLRIARCGNCGNTGYIYYDPVNYRAYECNRCSRIILP